MSVGRIVHFTCAGRTDAGVVRSGNEDALLMLPEEGIFVVADGMGGHAAGEVASEMAVDIIGRRMKTALGRTDEEAAQIIREAIREANATIFQRTLDERDKRGMGTTATAMVLNGARYVIGQVGDSRAYVLREQRLSQITKDHSYVQEQVDAGYLTPEQARTHPYSNVITRCVGANADVVPDIYVGAIRERDVFVLASDGLTGLLEDPDLHRILLSGRAPAELVDTMIGDANRRGGLDNVTVIVIRIDSVHLPGGGRETAAVAHGGE